MRFDKDLVLSIVGLVGVALIAALFLLAAYSAPLRYEVRAKISLDDTTHDANFLGICAYSFLAQRFGSRVIAYQPANLPPKYGTDAIIIRLSNPCARANKRKLKFATWFRLAAFEVDPSHYAVLLTDGSGRLIAPLPTGDETNGPSITRVEIKAISSKRYENRRNRPRPDDIRPQVSQFTAMLYRAVPKDLLTYFEEAQFTTPSGRLAFYALRDNNDLRKDAPREVTTEAQISFAKLLHHSGDPLFQANLAPSEMPALTDKDLRHYRGPYSFEGIEPLSDRLALFPGDIRFAHIITHNGKPLPLQRFARHSTNLSDFAIFDHQTDRLLVPVLVKLRLN